MCTNISIHSWIILYSLFICSKKLEINMDVLWLFSSALGSALVIVGLYLVLWEKTKEASGAAPSSNVNVLMVEEKSKQATKQQAQDVWKKSIGSEELKSQCNVPVDSRSRKKGQCKLGVGVLFYLISSVSGNKGIQFLFSKRETCKVKVFLYAANRSIAKSHLHVIKNNDCQCKCAFTVLGIWDNMD